MRNKPEVEETGAFEDSLHIPLPQLRTRMGEVLEYIEKHPDANVVVHCKTGIRARLAASILHNHTIQPVTVLNEVFNELVKKEGVKTVPYNGK